MKPITNNDYVELYARKLRDDNSLFIQQKKLLEAQFKGSASLFSNWFAGKDFKTEARKYLHKRDLI